MIIMGIHGGVTTRQHEPSACIIKDGTVVALCEEERYLRIKSCYGLLPLNAMAAALKLSGFTMSDIDLLVTPGETYTEYDQTIAEFVRHNFGAVPKIKLVHHQLAHLASGFYASGFENSLCLSLDSSGDGSSGFIAVASKTDGIKIIEDIPNTNSLGLFYTTITHFLGFTDGDEYKVMGLAPYGKPEIDLSAFLRDDSSGWNLDRSFLRKTPAVKSPFEPNYSNALSNLLKIENRKPAEPLEDFHKNLAASVQARTEVALMKLVNRIAKSNPTIKNLCYTGGVAMNCVANSQVIMSNLFNNVYIPPVTSDRGLSLGCAYLGAVELGDRPIPLKNAYLGDSYSSNEVLKEVKSNGCAYQTVEDPSKLAAELILNGKIIGWFQGRSEAGARALGNRSILAKAGGTNIRDEVNKRIKFREKFRPFAPVIQKEAASKFFDIGNIESPYMCSTFSVKSDAVDDLGAIRHVDGTARVQTVTKAQNEPLYSLLELYNKEAGIPVVLNTSFNLKGQPIVETPRDAIMTFFGCGLDDLIIGDIHIFKSKN